MSHIEKALHSFRLVLEMKVQGIWNVEFALRSSPLAAWTGLDGSAFHIYDLNGDLFKTVPIPRRFIIEDPTAAGTAAAIAAVENW